MVLSFLKCNLVKLMLKDYFGWDAFLGMESCALTQMKTSQIVNALNLGKKFQRRTRKLVVWFFFNDILVFFCVISVYKFKPRLVNLKLLFSKWEGSYFIGYWHALQSKCLDVGKAFSVINYTACKQSHPIFFCNADISVLTSNQNKYYLAALWEIAFSF